MSGHGWREDDEEFKVGGVRGGRSKPRFSFSEIKLLLEAVKRNRYIILRQFNHGVSAETKKQTWADITEEINSLGQNHREVRQIMKKWADLKCDGKRRLCAMRGPNGNSLKKKKLGPVEKMVHKILMLSPRGGDGDSDKELGEDEDLCKLYGKDTASAPSPFSYLNLSDSSHSLPGGSSFDLSPLSSPEKDVAGDPLHSSSEFDLADDGERTMDFDEAEESSFSFAPPPLPPPSSLDPLPDNALLRIPPVHTYSRSGVALTPLGCKAAPPPPSHSPTSSSCFAAPAAFTSSSKPAAAAESTSERAPAPPPATASSSSSDTAELAGPPPPAPSSSGSSSSSSQQQGRDRVAQLSSQSVQQQRAGRVLLGAVSHSLETLAQSVQLLVESQQEFVQESLLLQRETLDILRDFSSTALTILRDKTHAGPQHHAASRF